ncbi:MAG: IS1380 family transposase [bacterium]|nr:IS1380 family transposase [bacterium]
MNIQNITQCQFQRELFSKPLVVKFDQHNGSSDGGALLLKAADHRIGLTETMSDCLTERRNPNKIAHGLDEMLSHRVFAIACGYPDGNDAARLSEDPVHKMLAGRDPIEGSRLASQPTLSRFENTVRRSEVYRMGEALAKAVVDRHRKRLSGRAKRITIDLDPTVDPAHGEQQLSFFNGYYDSWCYLPVLGFLSFDEEPDQYLFAAVLRPGNAPDKKGCLSILRRAFRLLREAFPKARLRVRLDAGYAFPELFEFLETEGAEYAVAMAQNKVLLRRARRLMGKARKLARKSGKSAHLYGECWYRARTWSEKRRVIIKAEALVYPGRELKDNPRFIVTNLSSWPRVVYERVYCPRGEIENRIKELKLGMDVGRTSCSRFVANQFRVLLTAAAYVLMQELRLRAARTSCARSQVWSLREQLIKLGAHVVISVRRIVVHLPASYPFFDAWNQIAFAFGARVG